MQLSANFSLAEFEFSQTAARLGIDNTAPPDVVENLRALCAGVLQPLRDALDKPLRITSGYRCAELNIAIGGSRHSQHVRGEAADIVCPGMPAGELAGFIDGVGLSYDQLILEFDRWVHVSHSPDGNRKQLLTARKVDGRTRYLQGLA